MRQFRVLFVGLVAGVATIGVPFHVSASEAVPRALDHRAPIVDVVRPGDEITRVVELPWRANMVGVSFVGSDPAAEGIEINLRARTDDGWTEWFDLHTEPDGHPDGEERRRANPRISTEGVWVGAASEFELLIEAEENARPIRALRLEAVNTNGDAHDRPLIVRALQTIGRGLTSVAPAARPAEALTSRPKIITRAEWGANESWRSGGPGSASRLYMAHVHHTAGSNSYSKSESPAVVRAIYSYHARTLGWSDIGYNFLVDRYGQIFEGRWGGVTRAVIGAHAGGFNSGSTGIALMGSFDSANPPSAMIDALQRLLAWKLDVHHVPPTGRVLRTSGGNSKYPAGTSVRVHRISGHRDTSHTACPGKRAYDLLPSIRKAVNGMGHPKIYEPEVPRIHNFVGVRADGPLTASATFSRVVSWAFQITTSGGSEVFSRSGSGATSMSLSWDGHGPDGLLVPTGVYQWSLEAHRNGNPARAASGSALLHGDFDPVFYDDDGSIFEDAINSIAEQEITAGCATQRYCPTRTITRGEMAAFLAKARNLPPADDDYFDDIEGSIFRDAINRIAKAQITAGCGERLFCPTRTITRGEMAAFLAKGYQLPPQIVSDTYYFDDIEGSIFAGAINQIRQAKLTAGCAHRLFCPTRTLTRGEMAAFIDKAQKLPA